MSNKEMQISEEQVQSFLAQSECSILFMEKDLGESTQEITQFKGGMVDLTKMMAKLVIALSAEMDIPSEKLAKVIHLSVAAMEGFSKEEAEDDD